MRGQNPVRPPSSRGPKEELELNVERMQQLLPPDLRKMIEIDKRAREAIWVSTAYVDCTMAFKVFLINTHFMG